MTTLYLLLALTTPPTLTAYQSIDDACQAQEEAVPPNQLKLYVEEISRGGSPKLSEGTCRTVKKFQVVPSTK